MISETEMKIGNCERVFDLAKARLEKILIALEEEAELHGASSQKLISDVATATTDFSVAINELNAAYLRRDSKAPLTVPPVENYVELFKKSAATRRAARDAARREEAAAAGELAAWLHTIDPEAISDSQKLANSLAAGLRRLSEKRPESEPPEPATLTEKITAIELSINRFKSEIDYAAEQLRPVRIARSSSRRGELWAPKSVEVQIAEEELGSKKEKLSQLIAQHKGLLAEVR
jgi:DNA-binding protein H-NS